MSINKMQFNGVSVAQVLNDLERGLEAQLGKGDSISLAGHHATKADLLATIHNLVKPSVEAEAARNAYEAKLRVRDAAAPAIIDFIKKVEIGVKSKVGSDRNVLASYGLPSPKEHRKLTAEEVVAKVAKMRATRDARGTMGHRQKSKVKGVVAAPVAPAVSATPTPAPAPLALVPAANVVAH